VYVTVKVDASTYSLLVITGIDALLRPVVNDTVVGAEYVVVTEPVAILSYLYSMVKVYSVGVEVMEMVCVVEVLVLESDVFVTRTPVAMEGTVTVKVADCEPAAFSS
jgi:hypothetical protein